MEEIERIYCQLTSIDLDEQRRIWDERGKGYFGEYCVFKELFLNVKGNVKFLMNLRIPTENGRTTEIDLLMIHETGIYVFEVKHYKGTIYGKEDDAVWTQFFRTTKNHTFTNPILQNEYHMRALTTIFPSVPLYSVIVFSNDGCDVRVANNNPYVIVASLHELSRLLKNHMERQPCQYDITEINRQFERISPYAPLQETTITSTGEAVSFDAYLDQLHIDVCEAKENFEKSSNQLKKQRNKHRLRWWLSLAAAILCCALVTFAVCATHQVYYENKVIAVQNVLQDMKRNFQHVDVYNDDNLKFVDNLIQVSNVQLKMSKELKNTALFSCTLTNTGDEYGIILNKDTRYIIMMSDGTVYEYDMFGERLKYSELGNRLSGNADQYGTHSGTLAVLEVYGVNTPEDIEYIKITNVSVWKLYVNNNRSLLDGLELELYSKS